MAIEAIVLFGIKDSNVLLIEKKKGFVMGKINGVGGKIKEGETPLQAVIRECVEEVAATPINPEFMGSVDFFFGYSKSVNWTVHIFRSDGFSGEPKESDEVKPFWEQIGKIPYDKMWVADRHWVPFVLEGKPFKGKVIFDDTGEKLVFHEIVMG